MTRNARTGLLLFFIYLLFYAAFVGLCAFAPSTMERTPIPGINIAILYGFALIVVALLMSVLYGLLCRTEGDHRSESPQ